MYSAMHAHMYTAFAPDTYSYSSQQSELSYHGMKIYMHIYKQPIIFVVVSFIKYPAIVYKSDAH